MTEHEIINHMGISLEKAEVLSREPVEKIMSQLNEIQCCILHELANECIESGILNRDDILTYVTETAHADYRMFMHMIFTAGTLEQYTNLINSDIHFMLNWIP